MPINYKSFRKIIQEELTDREKELVGKWKHHSQVSPETSEKIKAAMDRGDHTIFPLQDFGADAHPDVAEHLSNHGWDIHDYKEGTAKKVVKVGAPERGIPLREKIVTKKIGAILEETGATPDVKAAFVNDPERSGKSKSEEQYHVVISSHPHAVAGMSTGRSWADSSCMNMRTDSNFLGLAKRLEQDFRYGTQVAYLVHANDKGAMENGVPDNPIARIALKPFHENSNEDHTQDTIFRPEEKTYGEGNSNFTRAIDVWARENYPAKEGTTYRKQVRLYNDSYSSFENVSKDAALKRFKEGITISSGGLDHEVIEHLFRHIAETKKTTGVFPSVRSLLPLSNIANLSSVHVGRLGKILKLHHEDTDNVFHNLMYEHGSRFPRNMLEEHIEREGKGPDGTYSLQPSILRNPKLPDDVIDNIEPDDYPFVQRSKVKDKHIDKMIDAKSEASKWFMNRMNAGHLDRLAQAGILHPEHYEKHPEYTRQHFESNLRANLNAVDSRVLARLMHGRFAKPKDIETIAAQRGGMETPQAQTAMKYLMSNPHLNEQDSRDAAALIENHFKGGNTFSSGKSIAPNIGKHLDKKKFVQNIAPVVAHRNSFQFEDVKQNSDYIGALNNHYKQTENDLDFDNLIRLRTAIHDGIHEHMSRDNHTEESIPALERHRDMLKSVHMSNFKETPSMIQKHDELIQKLKEQSKQV